MSTTEILAQVTALTPAKREKVRSQLDALDSAAALSTEERQLIQSRVSAYRQNPGASIPWPVAEKEICQKHGL